MSWSTRGSILVHDEEVQTGRKDNSLRRHYLVAKVIFQSWYAAGAFSANPVLVFNLFLYMWGNVQPDLNIDNMGNKG